MRGKQTSKRYEFGRKTVDNKKYVAGIFAVIVIVTAFFFMHENQLNDATADGRINAEQKVIGIEINGTAKAYVFDAVDLVNDVIGGVPILVTQNGVYERRLNGRVLEFTLENNRIFDSNGREWNKDGTSKAGTLTRINAPVVPWYTWLSWHKDTEIYK